MTEMSGPLTSAVASAAPASYFRICEFVFRLPHLGDSVTRYLGSMPELIFA